MAASSLLLLLADGRFPGGGHAHSGGLEAAVAQGHVADVAGVAAFCRGRLHTAGMVAAALAAAAAAGHHPWEALDAEADARTPSPTLRAASRQLGRQLVRAAARIVPGAPLDVLAASVAEPHHPVALGAVAAAAGLGPSDAALLAAHDSITSAATAAVRLLGLDPFAVHAALAALAAEVDAVASVAAAAAAGPLDDLPATASPLLEIGSLHHATWEVRLFAS